ncbi:unnamed protein product [Litomosoides sigmodontis]|uniref:Cytoplasmic polyadenylation element-binding protein 1 n=1 Tax=Litomosoides sigmodontis TaxID=42156 RepID=A0A3P6TIZ1_LITSI|nr:unnamed protein product [Litomosoides sigmodontis]
MITDHCFWITNPALASEIDNKSSSLAADQKDYSFTLSGSAGCVRNDLLLDGNGTTVLDVNESLTGIISKEKGDDMQQSISDKDIFKCNDNHLQNKDAIMDVSLSSLSLSLSSPSTESQTKLANRALELAQSLFGPDTTIVKTFEATPAKHEFHFSDNDGDQITHFEVMKEENELIENDEIKENENSNHSAEQTDSFKNQFTSSASNSELLLTNRGDFTAFDVLNAIYRSAPVGGSYFAKPTSTTFSHTPNDNNVRAQLKNDESTKSSAETEQSSREHDEKIFYQKQRELMDEYFHRSDDVRYMRAPFDRQGQLWADQKYYEYYEYLCNGIKRALSHPGSFNLDCGAGNVHTPSNQQANGTCRAMKSNLYYQYSPGPEIYSRKVFVGGLPIDIDENELTATFSRFGPLSVDWPNKGESKSYFPPKGYVFLIFEYEVSVRALVQSCFVEDEKLFLCISSPLSPDKLVQIRPWRLADADYVAEASIPLYARRAVFVGGVPRPIKAVELAHIMDRLYGSVGCAGIDTDVEYKYPKGAGRIAFTNQNSYMKAITDRYVQLSHGEVEKRVELKPYVLDDQPCDECGGERCGHRHAPFFCPQLSCLQYYCEKCWTTIHGCRAREDHKPLVKEA